MAARFLKEGRFWKQELGEGGLQLLVLDLRFFLEASKGIGSDKMRSIIDDVIDKAIIKYCKAKGTKDTDQLKVLVKGNTGVYKVGG